MEVAGVGVENFVPLAQSAQVAALTLGETQPTRDLRAVLG